MDKKLEKSRPASYNRAKSQKHADGPVKTQQRLFSTRLARRGQFDGGGI